ncbi:PaaI family thioesterase [Schaalia turicensis]|uniref:PaaI family thioesterase n=1 Tax=Actinomycetaceae TaxID=2049 RepID=UPI0022E6EC68|nr:PaaI family thioesterase [Pauljensenia sp. OF14-1SRA]
MHGQTARQTTPDPSHDGGFVGAHWPHSLMEAMRMDVLEHSPEKTVISMPVEGNTQSAGILHGGASAALAETAASFASQIHARNVHGADRGFAMGTELTISHISSVSTGRVIATATAIHLGGSSTVHLVEIKNEAGKLISSARVTNRIMARRV